MGWFNPNDVGSSSKEGRGYSKASLNSRPALRLPHPVKAFQLYIHEKEGIALGVLAWNWAPTYSLLIQEARSNHPRLASLPSRSCSYYNPDRGCFKTLFQGQANYFYQPPSETTPKWERPFTNVWSKNPQISSSADGKSRPDYIPLWGS